MIRGTTAGGYKVEEVQKFVCSIDLEGIRDFLSSKGFLTAV